MDRAKAPEFDLEKPLPSAVSLMRAVLFSPRSFYRNFSAEDSVREPAVYVLLVSAVAGVLAAVLALVSGAIFSSVSVADAGLTVLEAVLFIVLSPLAVGVAAGIYLLSIQTFVGKVAGFRQVYRMLATAYSAMILAWIPLVGSFAIAYALMVLMGIGIQIVYRTSALTALVTALVGFVPVATGLILLRLAAAAPFG